MKSFQIPITIEVNFEDIGQEADLVVALKDAVIAAAKHRGFREGTIGLLITDDETIHGINREHLQHDYPTDVISFPYEMSKARVEGELVASLDTARREAAYISWPVLHELLLYVVHGTLHICGMDDQTEAEQAQMREAERAVLASLGIMLPSAELPITSDLNP
jgi:probable rRNA maturation factor